MTNLQNYLPPFISGTKTFSEILSVENQEFDNVYNDKSDIESQFDIDTATWALDIYEKELGIVTDYTKNLDYRRSAIKSRWRGTGKLDAALIKTVCDSFTNGDVQITFDGTIHVKFTSFKGVPPNIDDLKIAIEQIKPAYLALDYIYTYNTWGMVTSSLWGDDFGLTWEQLATASTIPITQHITWNVLTGAWTEIKDLTWKQVATA